MRNQNKTGGDEKMSLSFTEKLGFLQEVAEFMEKNSDALKKAGFDAVARGKEQKTKNDTVAGANEKQESLKAQLHEQTKIVNNAMRDGYVTASGNLDAMAGVLSKDSETSKVLRRLRSKVRQASRQQSASDGITK